MATEANIKNRRQYGLRHAANGLKHLLAVIRAQIQSGLKAIAKASLRQVWVLNSRIGPTVSLPFAFKLIVVLVGYEEKRMQNIEPLIRSALKCTFVEKVIASNNNPRLHIRDWVKITNPRLKLIDQIVPRGSGYRWVLIEQESANFILTIDDDILLCPQQMACLFAQLVAKPDVPHGLAGHADSGYIQCQDAAVNALYQVYAVTALQVKLYFERINEIRVLDQAVFDSIEYFGDDLVISAVGASHPLIHNVGFVLRCTTASQIGVATFTQPDFEAKRVAIQKCLAATSVKSEAGR
ncbi:MAG TPA: hypothetical protein VFF70_08190 [Anaerolineae bacterium]|nr:hypothetical protein [Anaerolineae bacterium]